MLGNTRERWGSVSIGLHWTIAALVLLVQVPAGITMVAVDPGTVQDVRYNIHKTNGIVIFLLAVVRLAWRVSQQQRAWPMENLRAHGLHKLLGTIQYPGSKTA